MLTYLSERYRVLSGIDSKLGKIYQFRICIKNVHPTVWRRVLVNEFTSLADFHYIIQILMSWSDTHLHCFNIRNKEFGIYHDGGMQFEDDPRKIYLGDFNFYVNERFIYEYNFNDDWELEIRVEKILTTNKNQSYPICISGEGATPPEDCGGHSEYVELAAQYNPNEIERHLSEIRKRAELGTLELEYIRSVIGTLSYWANIHECKTKSINQWLTQYASGNIDWDDYIGWEVAA